MAEYVRDLTARLKWQVNDRALDRDDRRIGKKKQQIGALQKQAVSAGKALVGMFAARAIVRGATAATDAAIAFDRTLADLQALLPGQTQRVKDLGDAIRDLSVSTGKDANSLSAATYQIISAFGDTATTVDNLRLVTQVATAGNTDASSAIDLLSAVTLAYGDSSLAAQRKVADLAFTTVRLGKTSLPELAAAVGQVTPSFAALGATQSEMFAAFTALAGVTGSTRAASTQMAAAATALLARTTDMDKAFKKLGVTSAKTLITKKGGLIPAMQALVSTTDGSAESIQKLVGNVRASRAVMNLTAAGAKRFAVATDEMTRSNGATARSADAVAGGAGKMAKEFDRAKAKADELERKIGDKLKKPMVEAKTEVLNLATALEGQLSDSMDVFQNKADRFEQSPGFSAIRTMSAFLGAGQVIGAVAGGAYDILKSDVGALGAAGVSLATGDVRGAKYIASEAEKNQRRLVAETGRQVRYIQLQQDDPAAAAAQARLARIGAAARDEFADLGGVRRRALRMENGRPVIQTSNAGANKTSRDFVAAARSGGVKAVLQNFTVKVEGNSVETALASAAKIGESLGDRLAEMVGNPTGGQ